MHIANNRDLPSLAMRAGAVLALWLAVLAAPGTAPNDPPVRRLLGNDAFRALATAIPPQQHAALSPPVATTATAGTIVFARRSLAIRGNFDLFSVRLNRTLRRLTTSPANDDEPSYSPDGSKIAFVRDARGGRSAIYTMRADGSHVRVLQHAANAAYAWPSWSPDSKRLAFLRVTARSSRASTLYVLDLASMRLSRPSAPAVADTPFAGRLVSWQAGERILLTARGLYSVNAAGQGYRRLDQPGTADGQRIPIAASASHDGRRIAVVYERPCGAGGCEYKQLGLIEPPGRRVRDLVDHASMPAWSRDGKALAYVGDHVATGSMSTTSRRIARSG